MVQKIKIMISSTQKDLYQYREKTAEVIDELNKENEDVWLKPVWMEEEPQSGKGETAVEVSKRWVESRIG